MPLSLKHDAAPCSTDSEGSCSILYTMQACAEKLATDKRQSGSVCATFVNAFFKPASIVLPIPPELARTGPDEA